MSALESLCDLTGISRDYTDIWGNPHETSESTRLALLAAMGIDTGNLDRALETLNARDWLAGLPPVAVIQVGAPPYPITLHVAARHARESHAWTLRLENGQVHRGMLRPSELTSVGDHAIRDRYRAVSFPLRQQLPLGYHRFMVDGPDLNASMGLIVTPSTCYEPEALKGDGRVWGPVVQLYAVRSQRNWGIGDFTDLKAVIERSAAAGAGIIGVNPLHALFPSNPQHCSPYSPSSRLFNNVLYLDVEAVTGFASAGAAQALVNGGEFQARLRALRAAELVDYVAVTADKLAVLELVFEQFDSDRTMRREAWQAFTQWQRSGGPALERFALYHALHEHFLKQDAALWGWPVWPESFRDPTSAAVGEFARANRKRIDFFAWLQRECELQLEAVGKRAWDLGLGVGVYQDLAVSVDRGGAEVWSFQDLYAKDASIGAPPDDFNMKGQDWGLPPMIPHRLRDLAYAPFIALLRANMRSAGGLRIDHVMGLLRLYWVPPGKSADEGAYVYYPMRDLLGILALESHRNQCMVIGEDLGTVPDALRAATEPLGVLSYRVLLFEKDNDGSFKPPSAYPVQALVAATTHDLPTLKGYWLGHDLDTRVSLNLFPSDEVRSAQLIRRAEERARLLLALERENLLPPGVSVHSSSAPEMTSELALAIQIYLSRTPSKIMVVQPEDVFGQLEQVNMPATTDSYPNWRRKLPLNIEEWGDDPRVVALRQALQQERGMAIKPKAEPWDREAPQRQPIVPRATYRLQFNRTFTFAQATRIVPYLSRLGITHVYASPYLKARPGSTHGYDITDHNALNPEIGNEAEFDAYVAALKAHGMGQVLDIVPNHMGVMGADNQWWLDVLENGEASAYAGFFDIDWHPLKPALHGKVLVPVLGDQYGAVLERGELKLQFDAERGEFSVWYFDHRFPVDPGEYPRILSPGVERLDARLDSNHADVLELRSLITAFGHLPARDDADPERRAERQRDKDLHKRHLAAVHARSPDIAHFIVENVAQIAGTQGEPSSFDALHALLGAQAYRLAYWRVASDDINYRRFFDIHDLAALRMEDPQVFTATHALVLRWLQEGKVDGLRIDHPDGLYDPAQYFRRLQTQSATAAGTDSGTTDPLTTYVVVEKILGEGEHLPADWPVHGTTGYDFGALLNGVFVDPGAATRMERTYRAFAQSSVPFPELLYRSKRMIMRTALAGELNVLASALLKIAEADRRTYDFTYNALRYALREVVASFPVYRTYIAPGHVSDVDRQYINAAVDAAKKRSQAADVSVFEFVRETFLTTIAEGKSDAYRDAVVAFAMKLQQYTSPVMAKGLEDTSFYIYTRLTSLNEVGGDPRVFGVPLMKFHLANRERQRLWSHSMLTTSTHDSKRSEDVRARIDVLSELPEEWRANVIRWDRINKAAKTRVDDAQAPDRNDEYLLYQTLLGAWPLETLNAEGLERFRKRIDQYMLKALREAKVHTSWINNNEAYEQAMLSFIGTLLDPAPENPFIAEFLPLQRKIARSGLLNSLSQLLLKLTVPGVPDLYQGTELWSFNLVDPDNRQSVDYEQREQLIDEVRKAHRMSPNALHAYATALGASLEDGRIKLYLTWRTLTLRNRFDAQFRFGQYVPLHVSGSRVESLCAFSRSHEGIDVVIAVGRWFARLSSGEAIPHGADAWEDTRIYVPHAGAWTNALTGESVQANVVDGQASIAVAQLFATWPWALLISE
ncbi:MAG: malto-oligosyltrehalose synthase [Betaproteobacteria bacterium]